MFGAGALGESFCVWEGKIFCRVRLRALFVGGMRLDITPYTSAEIPPAGAPSGFDSAAFFDFIACFFDICAAPLRMTRGSVCCVGGTI